MKCGRLLRILCWATRPFTLKCQSDIDHNPHWWGGSRPKQGRRAKIYCTQRMKATPPKILGVPRPHHTILTWCNKVRKFAFLLKLPCLFLCTLIYNTFCIFLPTSLPTILFTAPPVTDHLSLPKEVPFYRLYPKHFHSLASYDDATKTYHYCHFCVCCRCFVCYKAPSPTCKTTKISCIKREDNCGSSSCWYDVWKLYFYFCRHRILFSFSSDQRNFRKTVRCSPSIPKQNVMIGARSKRITILADVRLAVTVRMLAGAKGVGPGGMVLY